MSTIDLNTLTTEALGTALWVGYDYREVEDPTPLDDDYGVDDVSDETRAELRERLASFVETYADDVSAYLTHTAIVGSGYSPVAMLGHDYVLTCNGHGAGFWDRGLGELGDRLTDAAHAEGEFDLYVGDDGELYA